MTTPRSQTNTSNLPTPDGTPAPGDRVTRHIRHELSPLRPDMSIADALETLRADPPGGRVVYLYVLDDDHHLLGVIPTRRFLLNPPGTLLREIMVRELVTIPDSASILDAHEAFASHRLLALPVCDTSGRMLGVIDVEIYTNELDAIERGRRADALFQLAGVHLASGRKPSALGSFKGRFPWLLSNIAGGIGAAFLSGLFQEDMERAVAIALFIPVVLALAESVSIQSVSLALETIHGRRPTASELFAALRSEMAVGGLLGLACALTVATVAWLWIGSTAVVFALLIGISAGVTSAAMIGLAMPTLLRMARRDPQVAAGPIALAASDIVTLFAYFNLARALS